MMIDLKFSSKPARLADVDKLARDMAIHFFVRPVTIDEVIDWMADWADRNAVKKGGDEADHC